jgi:uncharacterized membrane protein HdeD (DUF308 family)
MDAADAPSTAETPAQRRSRGRRFVGLGLVLFALGAVAMLTPEAATTATGTVLGALVAFAGVVVIVQTLRDRTWHGFRWQLLFGAAEVVGGLLIAVKPLKGAAAVALVITVVLTVQGVTQLGLGFRIRPDRGWWWPALAGLVTLAIAAGLVLRFPYPSVETAGEMAGLALAFAGLAFVVMGASWLARREEGAR